jgi:ubiquinone/menaquinone biosynthesis C-methylase UbiE
VRSSHWLAGTWVYRRLSQQAAHLKAVRRHAEAHVLNVAFDKWAAGDAYETLMGGWSRRVADEFLEWLAPVPGGNWLEVGCGTGALTEAVCQRAEPASVLACDPSPKSVSFARGSIMGSSVTSLIAGADDLPRRDGGFDVIVSGPVLNFLPQPSDAVRSMRERSRRGGMLAAYV